MSKNNEEIKEEMTNLPEAQEENTHEVKEKKRFNLKKVVTSTPVKIAGGALLFTAGFVLGVVSKIGGSEVSGSAEVIPDVAPGVDVITK